MVRTIRNNVADFGRLLEGNAEKIYEMFDTNQLRAYFRCRDSAKELIDNSIALEEALYENKIIL